MAHNYRVHEMSSKDFHTRVIEGLDAQYLGCAIVTFEPWLVEIILEHKHYNRPISPSDQERLREALKENRWLLDGETIIFSVEGRLLDGQNRLTAVQETGKPLQSFTVWGLPVDVFNTIDIGKKRSGADMLAANRVPDCASTAAALRMHYRLVRGAMRNPTDTLPDDEIMAYYQERKDIRYSLVYGQRIKQFVVPSVGSSLHYLFRTKDNILADAVYDQLGKGELLNRRDPFYVLRELLSTRRKDYSPLKHNVGEKAKADMAAQLIEAWNAVRRHKTLTTKWLLDVDQRDFPEIM